MNWIKSAGLKVGSEKTQQEKVEVLEMNKNIEEKMRITTFEVGSGKASVKKIL